MENWQDGKLLLRMRGKLDRDIVPVQRYKQNKLVDIKEISIKGEIQILKLEWKGNKLWNFQ